MLAIIAAVLFVAWIFGFVVFHVANFGIHVLLIVALVLLISHFVRGARSPAP